MSFCVVSVQAQAQDSCLPDYQSKLSNIAKHSGRREVARVALRATLGIGTAVGSAALIVGTMGIGGFVLVPFASIPAGAGAGFGGDALYDLMDRSDRLDASRRLIASAYLSTLDPNIESLVDAYNQDGLNTDYETVRAVIVELDRKRAFCQSRRLLGTRAFIKLVRTELVPELK